MDERQSTTARIWMDDEGILRYVSIGVESTEATVVEGMQIVRELSGDVPVPILFDARSWKGGDPKSWIKFIAMIESVCSAAAIIVAPESPNVMGGFPEAIDGLVLPFRVFPDENAALDFLRQYLEPV